MFTAKKIITVSLICLFLVSVGQAQDELLYGGYGDNQQDQIKEMVELEKLEKLEKQLKELLKEYDLEVEQDNKSWAKSKMVKFAGAGIAVLFGGRYLYNKIYGNRPPERARGSRGDGSNNDFPDERPKPNIPGRGITLGAGGSGEIQGVIPGPELLRQARERFLANFKVEEKLAKNDQQTKQQTVQRASVQPLSVVMPTIESEDVEDVMEEQINCSEEVNDSIEAQSNLETDEQQEVDLEQSTSRQVLEASSPADVDERSFSEKMVDNSKTNYQDESEKTVVAGVNAQELNSISPASASEQVSTDDSDSDQENIYQDISEELESDIRSFSDPQPDLLTRLEQALKLDKEEADDGSSEDIGLGYSENDLDSLLAFRITDSSVFVLPSFVGDNLGQCFSILQERLQQEFNSNGEMAERTVVIPFGTNAGKFIRWFGIVIRFNGEQANLFFCDSFYMQMPNISKMLQRVLEGLYGKFSITFNERLIGRDFDSTGPLVVENLATIVNANEGSTNLRSFAEDSKVEKIRRMHNLFKKVSGPDTPR